MTFLVGFITRKTAAALKPARHCRLLCGSYKVGLYTWYNNSQQSKNVIIIDVVCNKHIIVKQGVTMRRSSTEQKCLQ